MPKGKNGSTARKDWTKARPKPRQRKLSGPWVLSGGHGGVFQVPKGIARLSLHSSSAAWSAHGFSLRLLPLHMCGIPRQADVPWSWPLQCSGVPTVTRLPLHGCFDFLQELCSYITQHGLSRSLDLWCKTPWCNLHSAPFMLQKPVPHGQRCPFLMTP